METSGNANILLNHAHTVIRFLESDVLPTAEAIARLSNHSEIGGGAMAEALQYHTGPGPEYRYRPLVQALSDLTDDQRPVPIIHRLQQVMAEVERFAQQA